MEKFALLIGVSESKTEDLPVLPSAIKDIKAMEAVLQNPHLGGFDSVKVLPNPIRQEMEEAIETLFANRKQEDLVLFYFSGHGILDEKGKFYLVTPQTRKNRGELVKSTAVASSVLQDNMSDSRCKRQVLILDACHSGAIADGITAKSAGRKVDIQKELGGQGRAILTSSSALEDSFHVEGYDLSIYTHYLIEGIQTGDANQDGDNYITVEELHKYVKEKLEQVAFKMPSQFRMSPQFLPVREGYEINLVRSPKQKVNPEIEYSNQNEDDLGSTQGIDYTVLQSLLKAKRWQLADQETYTIMNQILGDKWFDNLKNFPLTDLVTIDRLWMKYSQNRYGFTAQKRVFLECGGKLDKYPSNSIVNKFGERVGWKKETKVWHYVMPLFIKQGLWFDYKNLGFSSHESIGHLPVAQMKFIEERVRRPSGSRNNYKWVTEKTLFGIWVFASRLEEHT